VIRYKRVEDKPYPVAVECEKRGYPHPDADGATQFENTHFDTEAEAWQCVLDNATAWHSMAVHGLREAEQRVQHRLEELGTAAKHFDDVCTGIETFRDEQLRGPAAPSPDSPTPTGGTT
jgi:hypothetical protein